MAFFKIIYIDACVYISKWDPNSKSRIALLIRLIFFTPGFQLNLSIRTQQQLACIPVIGNVMRRILWYLTTIYFSCDIDTMAHFGPGLYFPHPIGIVIGGEWDVGNYVSILQGVTLGRSTVPSRRCRVGDRALIAAGAKVVGQIDIGEDARVGANAVVLRSVPAGATAVGVPARIIMPKSVGDGTF